MKNIFWCLILFTPLLSAEDMKKYEGRITDIKAGKQFIATCDAASTDKAKKVLESQHRPNRVDFVREISKSDKSALKRYEGRITDKAGNFTATCEARTTSHAKEKLESQHKPNRVDFVREVK
jgi:hypothetical protein